MNPLRTQRHLPVLTGVAVGTEVAMAAAALAGPDAHLVLLAGEVPLTHSWTDGQTAGMSTSACSLKPSRPLQSRKRAVLSPAEMWHCDHPGEQLPGLDGTLARKMPPASCHPAQLHLCHPDRMPPILATSLLPPSQALSLPAAAPNGVVPCPALH